MGTNVANVSSMPEPNAADLARIASETGLSVLAVNRAYADPSRTKRATHVAVTLMAEKLGLAPPPERDGS